MQGYCLRCKQKVEIKNAQSIILKNKRKATKGVCPDCDTKIFCIGK